MHACIFRLMSNSYQFKHETKIFHHWNHFHHNSKCHMVVLLNNLYETSHSTGNYARPPPILIVIWHLRLSTLLPGKPFLAAIIDDNLTTSKAVSELILPSWLYIVLTKYLNREEIKNNRNRIHGRENHLGNFDGSCNNKFIFYVNYVVYSN